LPRICQPKHAIFKLRQTGVEGRFSADPVLLVYC